MTVNTKKTDDDRRVPSVNIGTAAPFFFFLDWIGADCLLLHLGPSWTPVIELQDV
jgi:hypothetical protein